MACQHTPVCETKRAHGQPTMERIRCSRCFTATEWRVAGKRYPENAQNDWAMLMVAESDAARAAADATVGRDYALQPDQQEAMRVERDALTVAVGEKAAGVAEALGDDTDALRWRTLITRAGLDQHPDPLVALTDLVRLGRAAKDGTITVGGPQYVHDRARRFSSLRDIAIDLKLAAADATDQQVADDIALALGQANGYRGLLKMAASFPQEHGALQDAVLQAFTFRGNAKRVLTQKEYGRIAAGQHPLGRAADWPDSSVEQVAKAAVEHYMRQVEKRATGQPCGYVPITPLWVTFTGKGGYDPERVQAERDGLVPGQKYEVLAGLVDRNSTRLLLRGKHGCGYNSVMFDGVNQDHPCMLKVYG